MSWNNSYVSKYPIYKQEKKMRHSVAHKQTGSAARLPQFKLNPKIYYSVTLNKLLYLFVPRFPHL